MKSQMMSQHLHLTVPKDTLTEHQPHCDGYILLDDTVLCKDKNDGMVFKVLTEDLIIRRYLECTNIKVGDTVAVKFQTEIVLGEDNTVSGAISMYKGKVTDSGMAVPE